MVVDAIADQESVDVTDDEVGDRVGMIVTGAGRSRDRVAEHYSHEENRASLKQVMRREKTLDQLLKRAQASAETDESASAETGQNAPSTTGEAADS